MYRIGIGQDSHKFAKSRKPLVLGGIVLAKTGGLAGNSDADVILHSLANALSSAIGGDSLSTWFDEMVEGGVKDSQKAVAAIFLKLKAERYKVENVSICVEAKKPYVKIEDAHKMKKLIAHLLSVGEGQVGITFTSGEELTPFGRGLGIAAFSAVIISESA